MKVLHVDSSILGGHSVSRQLSAGIVAKLREATPDLEVTYRDLAAEPVPHLSGSILGAQQSAAGNTSAEVQQDLALSAKILDEFLAADVVVLAHPCIISRSPVSLRHGLTASSSRGKPFATRKLASKGLRGANAW